MGGLRSSLQWKYVPPTGGIVPWPVMATRTPALVLELFQRLSFTGPGCYGRGGDPVFWLTISLETGHPRWPSLPKMDVKQKRPPVRGYPKAR
ncbi:hypothetical protein AVEN_92990-1 [Araneus ventricosus]|uniref:Uncharacterized protein n=1 Tax=Araneus ventricosus TaxID=182803 RepID=A0A4Y2C1W2_ARAVE|nr:hypothetical protein AVEN_64941-1 [Araneus ventricosus]GBL98475.1 hypothetical protein AVEN_92990-1 [Araneus ventricosus]